MNIIEYINNIDREDISIHIPQGLLSDEATCRNGVLLISHELSKTGAPLQLLELAKTLCELGYQPFIYSLSEGDLINDYLDMNIPVICGIGPAQSAEWIDKLVADFRIVFINTLLLAAYVRYLTNAKRHIFWWIHESSFMFKEKYCVDIPINHNLKILAASEKTRTNISKYIKRDSALLNVCVEDCNVFETTVSDKKRFLWAGFLDYNKSPETLFKAILDLPASYAEKAEFIVVGQSRKDNEYAKLVETFASKLSNIKYINALPHQEFLRLMSTTDAVIVTSIEETTSLVAVEGLMLDKIVVVSEGCGIAKYINTGISGFVFPTLDFKKLQEIIEFIIDNDDNLIDIKNMGRSIYESEYSCTIFRNTLKNILDDNI